MDLALTEEQQLMQQAAARFARDQLSAGVKEREARHVIEHEVIRALGELGMLGVHVPEPLGGTGAGVVAYALALREIAAVDASVAVTMAVTNMVAEVISRYGTAAQADRYVPPLVAGDFFAGSFALSESGAGSDAASLRTRAEPTAHGWRITGEKAWITSGDAAGVLVVWARTASDEDAPSHRGISCFLVPGDAPGLHAGVPEEKMGLRASHTVAMSFDGVELPHDALLGELNQGFAIAMWALDGGRIGIGSQCCGIARRALEESVQYARERQQFGQSLSSFQAIQMKLANRATEIDAAWLLVCRAAWLKENNQTMTREAAMAKLYASEMANRAVRDAVQVFGGYGYLEESTVARLYRDCRVTQIYEGTSEIQRMVIARQELLR